MTLTLFPMPLLKLFPFGLNGLWHYHVVVTVPWCQKAFMANISDKISFCIHDINFSFLSGDCCLNWGWTVIVNWAWPEDD